MELLYKISINLHFRNLNVLNTHLLSVRQQTWCKVLGHYRCRTWKQYQKSEIGIKNSSIAFYHSRTQNKKNISTQLLIPFYCWSRAMSFQIWKSGHLCPSTRVSILRARSKSCTRTLFPWAKGFLLVLFQAWEAYTLETWIKSNKLKTVKVRL